LYALTETYKEKKLPINVKPFQKPYQTSQLLLHGLSFLEAPPLLIHNKFTARWLNTIKYQVGGWGGGADASLLKLQQSNSSNKTEAIFVLIIIVKSYQSHK
jgi:hypothetical protein